VPSRPVQTKLTQLQWFRVTRGHQLSHHLRLYAALLHFGTATVHRFIPHPLNPASGLCSAANATRHYFAQNFTSSKHLCEECQHNAISFKYNFEGPCICDISAFYSTCDHGIACNVCRQRTKYSDKRTVRVNLQCSAADVICSALVTEDNNAA